MGVSLAALALIVAAQDGGADFYINFMTCKTMGAALDDSSGIGAIKGVGSMFACSRTVRKMSCILKMDGEASMSTIDLDIEMDSPPMLVLNRNGGADHVMIDTSKHVAVYASRVLRQDKGTFYYGSKLCKGLYLTAFEFEMMEAEGRSAK